MNRFCISILFFAALQLSLFTSIFSQCSCYTDERSGVKICIPEEGEQIFPESWRTSPINGTFVPLNEKQKERSRELIEKCLLMYPKDVLSKNLQIVYLVTEITFYGQAYGGTNSLKNVYIANKDFTSPYIEQLFHAEFSSILLRNFPAYFDKEAWISNNASGFEYGYGGVNALKNKQSSTAFDEDFNAKGFLYQYATSSMENDFNSFAKYMFCPKTGFRELVEDNERLKRKWLLAIDFYSKIDSTLNEEYFTKILTEE